MANERYETDEIFTIKARKCKRCGGILTSKQAVEDGYGHVCKMKTLEEKNARQPISGQMTLMDYGNTQEATT